MMYILVQQGQFMRCSCAHIVSGLRVCPCTTLYLRCSKVMAHRAPETERIIPVCFSVYPAKVESLSQFVVAFVAQARHVLLEQRASCALQGAGDLIALSQLVLGHCTRQAVPFGSAV